MQTTKIAFIGAGNMAASFIGGLLNHGWAAQDIITSDIDSNKLALLAQHTHITTTTDNQIAIAAADVVVFAVKPQIMKLVTEQLVASLQIRRPLILSIAAGILTQHMRNWLGDLNIVRCMPNTPSLLQLGATGLYADPTVGATQRDLAQTITDAVGVSVWVEHERELDVVTALSGSGPAYFFLFMEALENAAQNLGLTPQAAHLLTLHTAFGATSMAMQSDEDLTTLRKNVTSPGGTTEKAILSFESNQFRDQIHTAIKAAYHRSNELSQQFGEE